MTLEELRQKKELTFQAIADALGKHKEAVFKIIKFPWRTSIKSFMEIAIYIGMDKKEAAEEWQQAKLNFKKTQYEKEVAKIND